MPDTVEKFYRQDWSIYVTLEENSRRDLLQVYTNGPWIMPDKVSVWLTRLDGGEKDSLKVKVEGRRIKKDGTPGAGISSDVFFGHEQMPEWLGRLVIHQLRAFVPGWEDS